MSDPQEEKKKVVDTESVLKEALGRADVPKLYANGFGVGLSNADIFIVFQRFGTNPVGVVNLSYTLAKTLAQRLGTLVAEFETTVGGQDILTTERIDEAFRKKTSPTAPAGVKAMSDEVH